MECNRDEALKAITIANAKFENKDFTGAKKIAAKAQILYPGLEGISQILTTLDVYISVENKLNGEVDWYGVLGVNPSADDETIRKQYRKLALVLHPDKNKSIGAEGAFKLLSEAWNLLSDKAKRLAYNQRRSFKGSQQKVPTHACHPSAPSRTDGYYNSVGRTTSASKNQSNSARVAPKSVPPPSCQRTDTFWTICHRCKVHYEYVRIYLNRTLRCTNCNKAFLASETSSPFSSSQSSTFTPRQRLQNVSNFADGRNHYAHGSNAAAAQKSGWRPTGLNSFTSANLQKNSVPGTVTKAKNVVQQARQKMKRAFTESHVTSGQDGDIRKRKLDDDRYPYGMNNNITWGTGGFASASLPGSRMYGSFGTYSLPNSRRELTIIEIQKMLMGKAQKEIGERLNEWKSEVAAKASHKEKGKESKRQKHNSTSNVQGCDDNRSVVFATNIGEQAHQYFVNSSADSSDKEDHKAASMTVPDPDFHDFDQDRTESSFRENEVWASYDNDDGMPRFYALINKVISRNPFKLRISWLNSETNSEFGQTDWVGSGFFKTCGEFRVGKCETCKSINSFSQKVHWSRGPQGTLQIFPKKGDVWALYRNWSSDWNEHTTDEVVHKYDMVMVLNDYNEQQGVSVVPLMKVVGFKTVFRPNLDLAKVKRIPKEEMFRFSHLVPHHLLTGQEAQNAPMGLLELDPAAIPLELLQVLTETNN